MSNDGPHWELSKENAAPLERGRNVKELEKRKQETAEERLESEKRIQHYELLVETAEDPLIHWLSYIKFHQDAYPSNTHDQFLLMERCTRALIGNPAYANDVRFIRVCVTYADKTQFPGDVFKYLHSQHVGTTTALFWIAWAWVAENKGDYAFAEKVYLKGLAKEAAPLKLLQQRHKQFQRRMSRHWLNTSQQQDEQDLVTAPPGRATLGGLDPERARRNDRASRPRDQPPPDQTTRTFQDRNAKQHPPVVNNGASTVPGSGTGFHIFLDENANDPDKGGYDLDRSRPVHNERELETEAERNEENHRAAETWNARGGYEARYGASTSKAPTALSFAIHVDDECKAREEQRHGGKIDKGSHEVHP
jgi:Mad3/BUB1 homology region 1